MKPQFWLIVYVSEGKIDNMTVIASSRQEAESKALRYLREKNATLKSVKRWRIPIENKQRKGGERE